MKEKTNLLEDDRGQGKNEMEIVLLVSAFMCWFSFRSFVHFSFYFLVGAHNHKTVVSQTKQIGLMNLRFMNFALRARKRD